MNGFTRQRWEQLWGVGANLPACREVFGRLTARYSEPHRHYHNARHITECLAEFDRVAHLSASPQTVELAIWFHDAVYDPRAADNEERSAELARYSLNQLGGDAGLCDAVALLVLATKKHETSLHAEAPLMVDVDLSILGQSSERFWEYEDQIRAEYAWVPREKFVARRAEILEEFLARGRIYRTEVMHHRFEAKARDNLEASIRKLRSS